MDLSPANLEMQRQADAKVEAVFDRLFVVLPSRPYTEEWAMGRDLWWALIGELRVHGRPGRKRYAWALKKAAAARGGGPHRHLKGMPAHAKRWNLAIRERPREAWEPPES